MLLDKNGKLVKSLDFRGTSVERLDRLTARELFLIITNAQQQVNMTTRFKATDLAPHDWTKTVYQPVMDACDGDRKMALRLFGVIIKQALITTPLLFSQEGTDDYEATIYTKETLKF
ncbi:MAG: hypothetical protein FWE38_00610 [Firmicutes bacterium]|nr:hypothetical protein [Bacillota bacterium]